MHLTQPWQLLQGTILKLACKFSVGSRVLEVEVSSMRPRRFLFAFGIGFLFAACTFVACSVGTARYSRMAPEPVFALHGAYNPNFNTENYDRSNDNLGRWISLG